MALLTHVQPNILVDVNGHAQITDFGLATVIQNVGSTQTETNERDHTARWSAPEIIKGEGIRSKDADVFSFAMVMIEVRHR